MIGAGGMRLTAMSAPQKAPHSMPQTKTPRDRSFGFSSTVVSLFLTKFRDFALPACVWAVLVTMGSWQARADTATPPPQMVLAAPMALQTAAATSAADLAGGPNAGAPADSAAAKKTPLTPVNAAWTQVLNQIVSDPPPPHLVRGTHYVISNEDRHDLWKKTIDNLGGAYIGVGTDQNYVLAGWQKPELLVLFDFDQVVVNLHYVYRVFFIQANTPDEFRSLWETKNEATAMRLLAEAYPHPKQRAAIVEAYNMSRYSVLARFRKVAGIYQIHKIPWFMTDLDQYAHVSQLFRAGRVVMVRGDLTVGRSLQSIADALTSLGVKLKVLYLSNAERYWTYTEGFRKSVLALPYAEAALVFRTRARPNGVYMYVVQDAQNFQQWVSHPKVNTVYQVTHQLEADPNPGLFHIKKLPGPTVPQIPHPASAHLKSK